MYLIKLVCIRAEKLADFPFSHHSAEIKRKRTFSSARTPSKMSVEDKNTAEYWIKTLKLWPHPGHETGYLNEVFRDDHKVVGTSGKERSAATNIYFLHRPTSESNVNVENLAS